MSPSATKPFCGDRFNLHSGGLMFAWELRSRPSPRRRRPIEAPQPGQVEVVGGEHDRVGAAGFVSVGARRAVVTAPRCSRRSSSLASNAFLAASQSIVDTIFRRSSA